MNRRFTALIAIAGASLVGCGLLGLNPNTSPTRASHSWFPIDPKSTHPTTDCNACHGEFATFQKFDCLTSGCHPQAETDPIHSGIGMYTYSSSACYTCHPTGVGVDHTKFFPIAAGDKHNAVACTSCHADATNRNNVSCAVSGCHDQTTIDPQHGQVGGYQYASPQCLKCHADSQINPVASHLPFQIQPNSRHYLKSCLTCHPNARADKPFGEDFNSLDCITACHQGAHHQSGGSMGCLQCHADGAGGG